MRIYDLLVVFNMQRAIGLQQFTTEVHRTFDFRPSPPRRLGTGLQTAPNAGKNAVLHRRHREAPGAVRRHAPGRGGLVDTRDKTDDGGDEKSGFSLRGGSVKSGNQSRKSLEESRGRTPVTFRTVFILRRIGIYRCEITAWTAVPHSNRVFRTRYSAHCRRGTR